MPDLNLDLGYFEHRKTIRLVGILGKGAELLPIKLWIRYAQFHPGGTGELSDYEPGEIASMCGWEGDAQALLAALLKAGFLERKHCLCIHEWTEHQGHIAALHQRAKTAALRRWAKLKKCSSNAPSNAPTNHPTILPSDSSSLSERPPNPDEPFGEPPFDPPADSQADNGKPDKRTRREPTGPAADFRRKWDEMWLKHYHSPYPWRRVDFVKAAEIAKSVQPVLWEQTINKYFNCDNEYVAGGHDLQKLLANLPRFARCTTAAELREGLHFDGQ
jgi:hypothetical protein